MDPTFAAEFPPVSRAQWLKLVEAVLKGSRFDDALVAHSYDGIRVEPLYPTAERPRARLRAAHGPWRVAQRVDHPDPQAANALALADLEGGADALALVFAQAGSARGFGLAARSVDELDRALAGVMLDLVQIRLDAGHAGPAAAAAIVALAERRFHSLADLDFDLGLDPVGAVARSGTLPAPWDRLTGDAADLHAGLQARGFKGGVFLADGRPYHEAGASEAKEVAAVLATAVTYLRALEARGHGLEQARDALSFLLVADSDEFFTIAKLRALRQLWIRVEEACGLAPKPIRVHAETAWRMMTRHDPWVNMLRVTVAAFSAAVGGADTITALPFTAPLGLPDAFARRIARNTQLILAQEANLWRVADPAAGSGAFEALTDELCDSAWTMFQTLEREGGITASLASGAVQARIAAVRAERDKAVATRRDAITGTSEFPDLGERPVSVLIPSPSPQVRDVAPDVHAAAAHAIVPLPSLRSAEPFERLREASDAQLALRGRRPKVFLANLGPPAGFAARAGFAKTFFEAGGIEAVTNDGFASPEDMLAAFRASGARLACLCASDIVYESLAVAAAKALVSHGAKRLYMVARPNGLQEQLKDAGVSEYIFAGCDTLSILETAAREAAA
jgi:methylmalonyl-CoA mutase